MNSLIEKLIVYRTIAHLLEKGCTIFAEDPEGFDPDRQIRTAREAADEHDVSDTLTIHVFKDEDYVGHILFIAGNDDDVLSNYSTALDDMLQPIFEEQDSDDGFTNWILDRLEAK